MRTLDEKVAIITGGGSGIGEATAMLFAREGCKTIVADIDEQHGKDVAERIRAEGGDALFCKADVTSPEDQKRLVSEALSRYGKLDIAVNNAGIAGPLAPTGEYPVDGWNHVISVNLSGVFYGMRYQIPAMTAGGSIINISSILGAVGTRMSPAYVSAKHGVIGLTKAAALEYADRNIRVNAVGPGYIMTPLLKANLDEATLDMVKGLHPLGRLGEAHEVAELILWLASDKASFVTGSYFAIDGGYLAQ
jgi:NAD(P)-dependent dehydrogenase (short-subunit alcohol dehydrogenase family)